MVFIIREWGIMRKSLDYILRLMETYGLNIVLTQELDHQDKEKASKIIRGGNWGAGPWVVSGGLPSIIVVAYDYHPIPMRKELIVKYPFMNNSRYLIKRDIRDTMNEGLLRKEKANGIHSSDDEFEAWEYIEVICPEKKIIIRQKIEDMENVYRTKELVLGLMNSNLRRGKTEIIQLNDKLVIKKTFKPGRERYLKREIIAYKELSKKNSLIPKLIDFGDNYIVIPYYQDVDSLSQEEKNIVLKKNIKTIASFIFFLYEEGYAHLDFHPNNVLYSPIEGIKVIDFEFLYRYKEKPSSVINAYDIVGVPLNFEGDLPVGYSIDLNTRLWEKACGYHLSEIVGICMK